MKMMWFNKMRKFHNQQTVAIAASGQSLVKGDCDLVRELGIPLAGVNNTYQLTDLDLLYSCDKRWWDQYRPFHLSCPKWTCDKDAAETYNLNYIESLDNSGLSLNMGQIHQGGNSGYQLLNLICHYKPKVILLLGYDMKGKHFHGSHPPIGKLTNPNDFTFNRWIRSFETTLTDLITKRILVINCNPESALKCYPQMTLLRALELYR